MRYSKYLRTERAISAADAGGIVERWRWARQILTDTTAMSSSGKSLKNGIAEKLIATAKAGGEELTEREIQYRLRCGRAYPTEAQIRRIRSEFKTWGALRDAGFPDRDRDADEPDYDPRWTAEKDRDAARKATQLLPADDIEQLDLFPADLFGPLSTVGELEKHAEELAEMSDRFARRSADRIDYVRRLKAAVGGDTSATWEQARHALDAQGGE